MILQKQREVDRLEAQVDMHLLQQAKDNLAKPIFKATLAPMREEMATPSPEIVELTEPDTPPSSQNRSKSTRRVPFIAVDVGVQACSAPVSESSVSELLVGYLCLLVLVPYFYLWAQKLLLPPSRKSA